MAHTEEIAEGRKGDSWRRYAPLVCLLAYVGLRIALLPADGSVVGGFSHDSAYNAIVAQQLLSGNGYVNPVSWLLFLNPRQLPMPFHNSNPGYLTLIAAVSLVSGRDVFWAGFFVSAVCHAALLAAVYLIMVSFLEKRSLAVLSSVFIAMFPGHIKDSLSYLPDALCTALTIFCFAMLLRSRTAIAGALFGLAWLTRSTAILSLPGIVLYIFLRHRPRQRIRELLAFLLIAAAVASPWLIRTAQVWGNPFHSDASFYLWQDYYADRLGVESVQRLWRSLQPPPSLSALILADPAATLAYLVKSVPSFLRITVYEWADGSKLAALVLLLWLGLGAPVALGSLRSPEVCGSLWVCLVSFAVLAVRGASIETRYLGPATTLLLMWSIFAVGSRADVRKTNLLSRLRLACAAALFFFIWPFQWTAALRSKYSTDDFRTSRRDMARVVHTQYARGRRVMISDPYFYAAYTGGQALSIPSAPKQEWMEFAKRYEVCCLVLDKSTPEIPESELFPAFRLTADLGRYTLWVWEGQL